MPMFEFRCKKCGLRTTTLEREAPPCVVCTLPTVRVFSFNTQSMFEPHYNVSVGKFVNTRQEFRDELKKKAEAATARTGIYHNYVEADQSDSAAFGATDEGMESYHRRRHDTHVDDPFADAIVND